MAIVDANGEKFEIKLAKRSTTKSVAAKARAREKAKAKQKAQKNFDTRFIAWYAASIKSECLPTELYSTLNSFVSCNLELPSRYSCNVNLKMSQPFQCSGRRFKFAELYYQKQDTKSVIREYDSCVAQVASAVSSDLWHLGNFVPLERYDGRKVNRIDICAALMLALDVCKETIDLFAFRHLLFRIHQFILIAIKCTNHNSADKSQCQPTSSSSTINTSMSLLQQHKSLVNWMESVRTAKPTKEMIKSAERRNLLPTIMTMTKPFIFDQLFRTIDLPTLIATFLFVTRSQPSSSKMPTALTSIVDEYCRLDPLNADDEKVIATNLLKE